MAYNFPNAPTIGQVFQPVAGGPSWQWNGDGWQSVYGSMPVIVSDAPPSNAFVGQLWWESDSGDLYVWYDDGDSKQWVQISGVPAWPVDAVFDTVSIPNTRSAAAPADPLAPLKIGSLSGSNLIIDGQSIQAGNAAAASTLFLNEYGGQVQLGSGSDVANLNLNGGLIFPGVQIPNAGVNVLDDYEEGNWTPAYVPTTGAFGSLAYQRQYGRYIKIGRAVILQGSIYTGANTIGTAAGTLNISGLPFTVANDSVLHSGCVAYSSGYTTTWPTGMLLEPNLSTIRLYGRGASTNTNQVQLAPANLTPAGNVDLYFFTTYLTNN